MLRKSNVVTQADLARVLGLSKMTVSYALRDSPMVSEATRLRVKAMAKKMGYRPNPMVTALMQQLRSERRTGKADTLAFVLVGFSEKSLMVNPSLKKIHEGARQRADQAGFGLEVFVLDRGQLSARRLSQILLARGIRGCLLMADRAGLPLLDGMDWSSFACATYGFTVKNPDMHRVCAFHLHLMLETGRQLETIGARRIGLVMDAYLDDPYHLFLAAFHSLGLTLGAGVTLSQMVHQPGEEKNLIDWIRRKHLDVVISVGQATALSVYRELQGQEVKVFTLEHPESGPVAGMSHRNFAIGAAMVDVVTGQLNRNEYGIPADPKMILIKGAWREASV